MLLAEHALECGVDPGTGADDLRGRVGAAERDEPGGVGVVGVLEGRHRPGIGRHPWTGRAIEVFEALSVRSVGAEVYIGRVRRVARRLSPQTIAVLAELANRPQDWRYGYELGKDVGLRAGTLYPILMRLTDRGLLEAGWETDPPPGRPPRHLYRLTGEGERAASQAAVPRSAAATLRLA